MRAAIAAEDGGEEALQAYDAMIQREADKIRAYIKDNPGKLEAFLEWAWLMNLSDETSLR